MTGFLEGRLTPGGALFSTGTRSAYRPSSDYLNVSLDFNAAPNGNARGTEVIIPNNATPEVRAAAEAYNNAVVQFARDNGIADYPNRGVRTRAENGRGVPHTVHTEPFFNSDTAMQELIKANPRAFAKIYSDAFGGIGNARVIAPHGAGRDRGAVSDVFGTETDYGEMIVSKILGNNGKTAISDEKPRIVSSILGGTDKSAIAEDKPKGLFGMFGGQDLTDAEKEAQLERRAEVAGLFDAMMPEQEQQAPTLQPKDMRATPLQVQANPYLQYIQNLR